GSAAVTWAHLPRRVALAPWTASKTCCAASAILASAANSSSRHPSRTRTAWRVSSPRSFLPYLPCIASWAKRPAAWSRSRSWCAASACWSSCFSTSPANAIRSRLMELVLKALVVLVQLALGGFVVWGGWLCFREWLRADGAPAVAAAPVAEETPQSFERVASLVLLALLCTAIVGIA